MNYLLEFTICTTLFYGLYYLIFRRLTFVRLNRVYLLSSLVFGLSLPLISYQIKEVVKIPASVEYEETSSIPLMTNSSTPLNSNIPIEEPFDWSLVLQGIYVLGILFMLIKFSIIVYKLLKIKRVINDNDFISTQSKYANSSFFNLIFIDDSNLTENEINQILEHEKWHIRLFHSYDLLFVEILKIIFWFNPILWLYQRSLSEVHEYEVDTRMIQVHNPQNYAQLLLKLATGTPQLVTTHQFSRKPLTDRIHFLFTKQKSVPMKRLAYLSVLPILGAFFMAFSVEKVVDYQEVDKPDETYFKVYKKPDNKVNNDVLVKENKVISNLVYGKNRVALTINPAKFSEGVIEEASHYFKNIGFNLQMTKFEFRNNEKGLNKIELTLTEDIENKKKYRSKITDEKSELLAKFTFDLKKMKRKRLDDIITILADRSTGEHFVASLAPPPPPSAPPKAPPAPPKPPLPPVKVGILKSEKRNSIVPIYTDNEITKFVNMYMLPSSYGKLTFEGKNIGKGKFLSERVTQKDWQIFLEYINNDNYFSKEFRKNMIPDYWDKIKVISEKSPVKFVSFDQANEYCKWQSEMFSYDFQKNKNPSYKQIVSSNSKLDYNCRLPTEKEWEKLWKKYPQLSGFCYILETNLI